MNIGLGMSMDMRMEQKLTPQMIQSLKLLQVSALELELILKQELEINPVLELEEPDYDELPNDEDREQEAEPEDKDAPDPTDEVEDELMASTAKDEQRDEIDWEAFLDDGFDLGGRQTEEKSDPDERFEKVPVYQKSLEESLLNQLDEKRFDPELRPIVEYLIGNLSDSGFLDISGEDLLQKLGIDASTLEEAVAVLQRLDPAGIGARDLRECLLIQLSRLGKRGTIAWRIIDECFGLLQKLKIPTIARRLDCTPEEIQTAIREVGQLEPRPGGQLSVQNSPSVIPDLIVEKGDDDKWIVLFNDRTVPSLRISKKYEEIAKRGSDASSEDKKFVREKLNSAAWLLRSIDQRKGTMLKVMYAILDAQKTFFEEGPGHLNPLVLEDIAKRVEMHISTVSRVTNEKYVQTPHGVFELKSFFSASVTQEDGTEVSSVEAREAIKRLIENENPEDPLSDQKIVDVLKEQGLDVARRTVAKYRDLMNILPARMRRKF